MALRILLTFLAAGGICWAIWAGPPAANAVAISATGRRIAEGGSFQPAPLERLLATSRQAIEALPCQYDARRGRLFAATRLAEIAFDTHDFARLGERLGAAREEARSMLRCSPYDTFAWFSLYWTSGNLDGFDGKAFALLAMSYRTGPREGWIGYHRNPYAASVFQALPEELRERVLEEWAALVGAWKFEPAAKALLRMAGPDRERFFDRRSAVKPEIWNAFARFIEDAGSDLILPGAKYPQKPWL